MQLPSFFVQKKTLVVETIVLVIFLVGVYYLYTIFSEQTPVATSSQNNQLLGQNLTLFLKAESQDKLSFDTSSFMSQPLISQLQDFTETILPASSRGRDDPFAPYAFTRSIR